MTHDSDVGVTEDEPDQVTALRSAEPIFREVLDVERQRISRDNRRTALMEKTPRHRGYEGQTAIRLRVEDT